MIRYVLAALGGLFLAQAAAAAPADYNVYAKNNAYISGGSYGRIASGSFTNANGPTGTNFTSRTTATPADTAAMLSYSASLKQLAATGTLSSGQWTPGDATFTGTTAGINVFTIDAAHWSQLYALTFAGPGTGAIVNITGGTALSNYVNLNFGSLAAANVVLNFTDATAVTMGGMTVRGTLLAPKALVTLQGGSVAGSVIADAFHSEGTTIGGTRFTAFAAPGGVPEPGSWALMILGFGVVGTAARRRGAVARVAAAA